MFSPNTYTSLLWGSFTIVMPSVKDTISNPGTQGQVAKSARVPCITSSNYQSSAVSSSTMNSYQINRPWGSHHKPARFGSCFKSAEDMNPSKIPNLFISAYSLKSLEIKTLEKLLQHCCSKMTWYFLTWAAWAIILRAGEKC